MLLPDRGLHCLSLRLESARLSPAAPARGQAAAAPPALTARPFACHCSRRLSPSPAFPALGVATNLGERLP